MTPRPASTAVDDLASKARSTQLYVARLEKLVRRGGLTPGDLRRAYSGAYLKFYAHAEATLEFLFLGLLMGRLVSTDKRVKPLISVASENVARKLVLAGRRYADWLPFERFTQQRAEQFFSSGLPFCGLPKSHLKSLKRAGILRNAVAHHSQHSRREFVEEFVEGKGLPPDQRSPSGYLCGTHAVGQTRLNFHLAETLSAFRAFCV